MLNLRRHKDNEPWLLFIFDQPVPSSNKWETLKDARNYWSRLNICLKPEQIPEGFTACFRLVDKRS